MQHLDEGTIHAWLDGALASDDAAAAARHVSECRDCAALVAEARGMIAATSRIVSALDDVPAGVIPTARQTPPAQHSTWRRLRLTPARAALAATVLLAAGTLFASRHNQIAKESAPPMAGQAPAAALADSQTKSDSREVATRSGLASPPPAAGATATAAPPREQAARNSATAVSAKAPPSPPSIEAMKQTNIASRAGGPPAAQAADVAAAPVAAAPALPRAETKAVDSRLAQRAPTADTLVAADANRAGRRAFNRVQQLEAVTGAAAGLVKRADVQGCYELSADSANTLRGIPLRFALQHAPGTTDYVVRALSADNRLDSLVPGGSWRSFAGDRATVSFAGSAERQAVVLQFSATGATAQASAGGQLVHLAIQRVDCRP